jgi:hypothetical protein
MAPNGLRIEQLKETLADAQRYKDTLPSVIGGDFNLIASEGMAATVPGEAGFHHAVGLRPPPRGPRDHDALGPGSDHFPVSIRIY